MHDTRNLLVASLLLSGAFFALFTGLSAIRKQLNLANSLIVSLIAFVLISVYLKIKGTRF